MTHPCPCCGNSTSTLKVLGQKGCVRLLECPACQFVFADPEVWQNPYEKVDYYDPKKQPIPEYPIRTTATDSDRLAVLLRRLATGRLLEFGGGLGSTAIAAQRSGFDVTILEESEMAVAKGRQFHPDLTWIRGAEIPQSIAPASFAAVTAFHLLEHVPNPGHLIGAFAKVLMPSGFLLIEVPNWGSNFRKMRGMNWHYVLDHHVNYFTRRSMARLVEPFGFKLQKTIYRRTLAINERQRWKEPLKRIAAFFGFGDVLRCLFQRR